ncbi:hypothetical protein FH972_023210 [Carpinus fangiana]|uniref:Alpha/beta hydrolase fold-3 domain-containing protein n=1 Tax=Carpinus fangiana TaxID=176857 RepID=A0A5N6KUU8_9ROSI|nr:hypothetical protein FH972_023210 [Carpinus fangiana]
MVFNAASVGVAVTPTVLETTVSHYLKRRPRRGKPTAHLSYDAALNLIRQFLVYSSHHTVEEVQSFTAQWVPAPNWVKVEDLTVPKDHLTRAAALIQAQLGPKGIEEVGGPTWWQWRRDERPLRAEWVEMKKDHAVRTRNGGKTQRTMLYVHGGGYYFGSVDEHRYQIQRHARKLQARVLCPRYRLSPQFPFPCGLLDCLATYLMMLETQAPETIILAGDSAGGGMVLALQIILRDQGIPLPAGSVLISPWVDLTHSFPSVAAENPLDYIPPYGFHHKPSAAWPPPNSDDLKALEEVMVKGEDGKQVSMRELKAQIAARAGKKRNAAASYTADEDVSAMDAGSEHDAKVPGGAENLTIVIDGVKIELKDQIQMYAPNSLLSHPLVSPVLQASLGGLPPMQVCVGGGEMLRDEQIYLAHKAAHPSDYPPPPTKYFDEADISAAVAKYPPTKVQLQVWDDLCHVGPTLSFTKPAKYMFRSIAQFGAWALAAAQRTEIRILDDDEVSDIGSATSDEQEDEKKNRDGVDPTIGQPTSTSERESRRKVYEDAVKANQSGVTTHRSVSAVSLRTVIGKAGDPLPPFHKNMIRQRVTRHGDIFPLPPASQLAACKMSPENVGIIKTGPVRKWLNAADAFDKNWKMGDCWVSLVVRGGWCWRNGVGNGSCTSCFIRPFACHEIPPPAVGGSQNTML